MFYAIVPVTNGMPDLDWANPPLELYQLNETDRYCVFTEGTEARETWQVITEAECLASKPIPSPAPPATSLDEKVDALGQMVVQLMLMQGGGA